MKIVIPSRKRANLIQKATLLCLPNAFVSISEEDVDSYHASGLKREKMIIHPNDVVGLQKTRNWILRNVGDETVVMVDDDMAYLACMVGEYRRRITDEGSIMTIFRNSEECAKAIPTSLFCYSQTFDIRKSHQQEPFGFIGYPQSIAGIIGRGIWYDETFKLHDDVDYALQVIQKHRVVWQDKRFGFAAKLPTKMMGGGLQGLYSQDIDKRCRSYLKNKWGKYYTIGRWKLGGVKSTLSMQRKQSTLITPDRV